MPSLRDLLTTTAGGAAVGMPGMLSQMIRARSGQDTRAVGAIERNLTPQEMQIVNYHRSTVQSGNVGRDEQGRPVTVYSTTIQVPEGPLRGRFVTVPGYFDGRVNTDERAIYDRWRPEIAAGRWPVYDDPHKADARAKYLHGIMDIESQ